MKTASQTDLSRCILSYEVEFRLIQEDVLQATQQTAAAAAQQYQPAIAAISGKLQS